MVWEIYGEWNRNTVWASMFGTLETFWELAHLDILDFDYWSAQYEAYGGFQNWDRPDDRHAMADYGADYGGIGDKNPSADNAYCHHPGCYSGSWSVEVGFRYASYSSEDNLELGFNLTACGVICLGGGGNLNFSSEDPFFQTEFVTGAGLGTDFVIEGVGGSGLLLMSGYELVTDYSSFTTHS